MDWIRFLSLLISVFFLYSFASVTCSVCRVSSFSLLELDAHVIGTLLLANYNSEFSNSCQNITQKEAFLLDSYHIRKLGSNLNHVKYNFSFCHNRARLNFWSSPLRPEEYSCTISLVFSTVNKWNSSLMNILISRFKTAEQKDKWVSKYK